MRKGTRFEPKAPERISERAAPRGATVIEWQRGREVWYEARRKRVRDGVILCGIGWTWDDALVTLARCEVRKP